MIASGRSRVGTQILLLVALTVAVAPIVLMWFTALKDSSELANNTFGPPRNWRWSNFSDAWSQGNIGTAMKTSGIIVAISVVATLILSTLGGFAFGMFEFPGKRFLLVFMISGIFLPIEVMMVPLWEYLGELGLRNSYAALIVPYTAQGCAFGIFWMQSFFRQVPPELVDAAVVDGAGPTRILRSVLLPIGRPALSTLAVLTFMWNWNEFLLSLVLIQDPDLRTASLALSSFQEKYVTNIPLLAAAATMISAPVLITYAIFNRKFIGGLAAGAIKG